MSGIVAVITITVLLVATAVSIYWWISRPVGADRAYAAHTLPLFGSDIVIDARPIDESEGDGDASDSRGDEPVTRGPSESPARIAELVTGQATPKNARAIRFTPPSGAVPVTGNPQNRSVIHPRVDTRFTTEERDDNGSGTESGTQTVRFDVPTDGTLQFLSGRLVIVAGDQLGHEIRFVRFPSPDGVRITFGRLEGARYRHVQLRMATVSRMHAAMTLTEDGWTLCNLSTTNPVVCNDHEMSEGETILLTEGDHIEMGEVVFRFHAH